MSEGPLGFAPGQLRDRLANERTLLAWVRTALALMGFGLVVAKFSLFLGMGAPPGPRADEHGFAHALGVAMVLAGVGVMVIGGRRTRAYARIIDPEARQPGSGPLALTVVAVAGLGVALAIYLVFTGS